MSLIRLQIKNVVSPGEVSKHSELMKYYTQLLRCEELLWYQKSRTQWLTEGNLNTKFYHVATLVRRRRNRVAALKVDGSDWCFEETVLKEHAQSHFEHIYTDDRQTGKGLPFPAPHPTLTDE